MKTFEEMQEYIRTDRTAIMQRSMRSLENGSLNDDIRRNAAEMVVQECQTDLANIDELTTIEIGAVTNSLISSIQSAYKIYLGEYWSNFEGFLDKYVVGLNSDGTLRNGMFFGQSQCLELGIGVNELLCLKGRNPSSDDFGDPLRQMVNANLGANIPMSVVEQQALKEYEAVMFSDDMSAQDKTFTRLKEVQRDSGTLKVGGTYYILASNQAYQDAKARCSGRNI